MGREKAVLIDRLLGREGGMAEAAPPDPRRGGPGLETKVEEPPPDPRRGGSGPAEQAEELPPQSDGSASARSYEEQDLPAAVARYAGTRPAYEKVDETVERALAGMTANGAVVELERGRKIHRELRARGASREVAFKIAAHGQRRWYTSGALMNAALPNRYFDDLGIPRLVA